MNTINVLFINCTLKRSPEISNTEALWHCVADLYRHRGCHVQQLRSVDFQILPQTPFLEELGDQFLQLFEHIKATDILIVGLPGSRLSEYQKLLERLQSTCQAHIDPATGQSPLYNTVLGVVMAGNASITNQSIAQVCFNFSQLGCINPPSNTVFWHSSMDTSDDFIAAKGQQCVEVNRQACVLVENSVAIATLLKQHPLQTNLWDIDNQVRERAKAATVEPVTPLTPAAVRTSEALEGLDPHRLTKRIWTMMQAGVRRGFTFKVLSLEDRIYQAEREGKGFIYKIYPGHFSFRRQYPDYDSEQLKSRKLELMEKDGMLVPVSYGTFKNFASIPLESLPFPIVAKPDSGSLSQNVFPNLQTVDQLRQAVTVIESSGGITKLESHIAGRDYRVLILDHQYAGCVERRPANVIGDGKNTILELFHLRNQEPGRAKRDEAHTTLHQLVFDDTSRRLLYKAGFTLDTVLPQGQLFFLQEKITAATGSDYVDFTDQLHPSIIESCIQFSHRFSTLTLGFDLIAPDITRPLPETGGAFNEYNFLPYVDLHEHCNIGQQRPVCRLIWDHIETHANEIVTSDFNVF